MLQRPECNIKENALSESPKSEWPLEDTRKDPDLLADLRQSPELLTVKVSEEAEDTGITCLM